MNKGGRDAERREKKEEEKEEGSVRERKKEVNENEVEHERDITRVERKESRSCLMTTLYIRISLADRLSFSSLPFLTGPFTVPLYSLFRPNSFAVPALGAAGTIICNCFP